MKVSDLFLFLIFILALPLPRFASPLGEVWKEGNYRSERISSYDRKAGNDDFLVIPKQSTTAFANLTGSGIIKHIWITLASKDPMIKRNALLKITWDGSDHPSVLVPIGDFFGQGWGEDYITNSLYLVAAPKKGKAWNSYFPMPFVTSARFEIVNESDSDISSFYFYIDYERHPSNQIGPLRFHANWSRSLTVPNTKDGKENEWALLGKTEPGETNATHNFVVLQTKGRGHFLGVNLYVDSPTPMWYGEGDDMIFIDSEEWPPRLHGTGTEDIFNTAWCPKEVFHHPFFGYPRVTEGTGWLGRTHLYRFWAESPLRYESSFLFTLEHGHANNLTLDLVSVAYFYQAFPSSFVPFVPKKEERQNKPEITFREIHRWRDSYRKESKDRIWGNE